MNGELIPETSQRPTYQSYHLGEGINRVPPYEAMELIVPEAVTPPIKEVTLFENIKRFLRGGGENGQTR